MTGSFGYDQLRPKEKKQAKPKVRWYQGYSAYRKADVLIDQLSAYLNQHRLTDTVCGLRMERRPKGEYYFFLTLETDAFGFLPDGVEETLAECPLLGFSAGGPYMLDDIQHMVSGELKMKALGQCITYRRVKQEVSEDPFSNPSEKASGSNELSWAAENLLQYLSSLGQGRWGTITSAVEALGAPGQARRLARTLQLLGHLELSRDGERWSVTPATFVRQSGPDGQELHYLTGARPVQVETERDEQLNAPARLRWSPAGEEAEVKITEQPALKLAEALPTLDEHLGSLDTLGGISTVGQQFAILEGKDFRKVKTPDCPGLYEIISAQGRKTTALLSRDGFWRRGDWYGLRYLNLQANGLLLEAEYDRAGWQLALPADQRPPELYERALVLSSGLLPQWRGDWLVYSNIAPDLATVLMDKLEFPLNHTGEEVTS